MVDKATDWGEEWYSDFSVDGATVKFTLFDETTDTYSETLDVGDLTTEPGGSNYSRQSDTVSTVAKSGDYGPDNDNQVQLDTSDSSQTVDHVAMIVNFASTRAGDSGTATDHIVAVAALDQTRDLSSGVDTVTFDAGSLELLAQ